MASKAEYWIYNSSVGFDFLVFWKYFLKIINWLKDLDLDSEETMPPKVQPVLMCT